MGFGISDEVMEKIRDSIWSSPYEYVYSSNDTHGPGILISRRANKKKITPFLPPAKAVVTPSYSALSEQELFLASAFYAIKKINKDRLKSDLVADRIRGLSDYYNELFRVIGLDSKKVLSAAEESYDNNAGSFLTGGFVEGILPFADSLGFSKPDFRDFLDDLFYMAKVWGVDNLNTKNREEFFFSYVEKQYGLTQSAFFSCPYCGEPLVKGIAFCPRCLENSRDKTTPRYRPPKKQQPNSEVTAEEPAASNTPEAAAEQIKQAEEEKWEISKGLEQLSEFKNTNPDPSADKISELTDMIEQLRKMLQERDTLIESLRKDSQSGETTEQSGKKRILVFGASNITHEELLGIASEVGLADVDFTLQTEYVKLKQYATRVKKDSSIIGIVLGPTPHKVKDEKGASSPAEYFKGEGFPFVVEAKTYSGELKITRQSARNAFGVMFQHLLSAGYYI